MDPRRSTRTVLLEWRIAHKYVDGDTAATAAIVWLVTTGPLQELVLQGYGGMHYEVIDIVGPKGEHGQNFRLVMLPDSGEPIPEKVRTLAPTLGEALEVVVGKGDEMM